MTYYLSRIITSKAGRTLAALFLSLMFLLMGFLSWVFFTSTHFSEIEVAESNCAKTAPLWDGLSDFKILNWNIQFLAGKNYIFFFDAIDGSGKDEAPSKKDIDTTFHSIVKIIKEEDPTFITFQEVDVDAKRTLYEDQVNRFYQELLKEYPCYSSTYYWRAGFIPHPHIMGSVGMKLSTFSKYKIQTSTRYALGEFPSNWITRQFRPKRALLESVIPIAQSDKNLHIFNTHLEAFAQGSNLMEIQVKKIYNILEKLSTTQHPWALAGDFNLLMPGKSYLNLSQTQRSLYQSESEIKKLTERFQVIPTYNDINGNEYKKWFTHFPNDPEVSEPDRTIDYIFYSDNLKPVTYRVRYEDTKDISDHLPLLGVFQIQKTK